MENQLKAGSNIILTMLLSELISLPIIKSHKSISQLFTCTPSTGNISTKASSSKFINIFIILYLNGRLKPNSTDGAQQAFVDRWIQAHTEDCNSVLKKPLIITEFGKSDRLPGYSIEKRNNYLGHVYNAIFMSAKAGGSFLGGIFWQLMTQGMENYADGYQVILEESPTTAKVIAEQSRKLHSLSPMK